MKVSTKVEFGIVALADIAMNSAERLSTQKTCSFCGGDISAAEHFTKVLRADTRNT